ncbi:MAG: OsmC family protein [Betaproteobacteria bacterium]
MAEITVKHSGPGHYQHEIVIGRHHLVADEPESAGGNDAGPEPFDFVQAGLGACTAITLQMYAERKGMRVTRINVELTHGKVSLNGERLDRIERRITLEGDLTGDERQRLLEIANRCPVHRALQTPLMIDTWLTE